VSIKRLMFIATSLRRLPSTLYSPSIVERNFAISCSVSWLTRVSGETRVFSVIFFAEERPMP